MITGEIKNRIDAIWDTYWVGGITNPMSVLEQMTYLFFMKMIDDAQLKKEAEANILGVKIANPTFKEGLWHNPETDNDVPYNSMQADGYSLDQKRTEVAENDIPDVIARFHNLEAEAQRTRKDKSFLVPVDDIRQNDYVLSINKYKEVEHERVEYEPTEVILERVMKLEDEIVAAVREFRNSFM